MAKPQELLHSIYLSIEESVGSDLPQELDTVFHTADQRGSDSDKNLPLLEFNILSTDRIANSNTDFVGFVKDDEGNEVGRIYDMLYSMQIQIELWTAQGSEYDPNYLGSAIRESLYPHDSKAYGKPFVDTQGNPLSSVWKFKLLTGGRNDDIMTTPTARKWEQNVRIWSYERFDTTEDYITNVDYPSAGDYKVSDNDVVIDNE